MGRTARLGVFFSLLGIAIGLCVFTAMAWIGSAPPTVSFASSQPKGAPVQLHLQTVGAIGTGAHPDWVSYLTQEPDGHWVGTTEWDIPASTVVDVTLDEYDSGSPLRNEYLGLVGAATVGGAPGEGGVIGGLENVNGKAVRVVDGYSGNGIAHTFSVPDLGINVPLPGVDGSSSKFCSEPAPCPTSALHNVITFSFKTPASGVYRWQCFIPCGLSYLYGNGGPMATAGYMAGFIKVVS